MNIYTRKYLSVAVLITTFVLCTTVNAEKPSACAGVEKVCTKNQTYDKTIEGKEYSCYDCSQTLCSGGGNSIVGSQSSSVCAEKRSKVTTKIRGNVLQPTAGMYVAPKNTNTPRIKSQFKMKTKENKMEKKQ